MRTNDEVARRNALRDYTEERDKLKSEKEKLVQENINLRKSLDEHTIGSVALESRNKTQSEQIDALRLDLQRSKDSVTSAVQEVQASKRELNRLQQTERELRERINQRDLTETKLKNDVSKAQEEALAYKREKEKFVKQTDQVKSYLSPSATESLSDL
ncbi:uncharacterized protein HMPREF1541_09702 [Cyphellophora europaea CBS 101466]|uniref:Uncharacterized protein n=1 Tax=Cyphellophora europaea (strain CBS 101466) TaxID=1220924 RepID=W2S825_CYPE1|nr:uncharacterized protein HMPREF1541_09702 [Cyphellophora europaea CBS 101466]ETN44827.1 hypothetical protein HMPREF1541_09702 [Cyphellophora europaea CBS 101466]